MTADEVKKAKAELLEKAQEMTRIMLERKWGKIMARFRATAAERTDETDPVHCAVTNTINLTYKQGEFDVSASLNCKPKQVPITDKCAGVKIIPGQPALPLETEGK